VNQELAKEGIPLPFGNKFWASNWPAKAPLAGLIIHWIPSIRYHRMNGWCEANGPAR